MIKAPFPIALTKQALDIAKSHRQAFAAGERPISLQLLLDEMADGGAIAVNSLRSPRNAVALGWQFSPRILMWALAGRPIVYLVWGLPARGLVRDALMKLLLRSANLILVNDAASADEVRQFCERDATNVPYLVDTAYYNQASLKAREDFLFCPSSNDRDGEILLALAKSGFPVIWMNNDRDLITHYRDAHANLQIVTRPSFAELRRLYQTCRACILPLKADIHAAGQTTALEALACGAPVILSRGRTSSIFEADGLVQVVDGAEVDLWASALAYLPSQTELDRRRNAIAMSHGPNAFAIAMLWQLRSAAA